MRLKLLVILSCAFVSLALAPHIPQKNVYQYTKHVSLPKIDKATATNHSKADVHNISPIYRIDQKLSLIPTHVSINPVLDASFQLQMNHLSIFVDPTVVYEFKSFKSPDFILITYEDEKHLNVKAIEQLASKKTKIIAPPKALDIIRTQSPKLFEQSIQMLPGESQVLIDNQDSKRPQYQRSLAIMALPMIKASMHYPDIHRGNGYLLSYIDNHVYISGDNETQDVLETLQSAGVPIDMALMPLYSRNITALANAIDPKVIIPYHYSQQDAKLDSKTMQQLDSNLHKNIKRVFLKWHSSQSQTSPTLRDAHQSLITFP